MQSAVLCVTTRNAFTMLDIAKSTQRLHLGHQAFIHPVHPMPAASCWNAAWHQNQQHQDHISSLQAAALLITILKTPPPGS